MMIDVRQSDFPATMFTDIFNLLSIHSTRPNFVFFSWSEKMLIHVGIRCKGFRAIFSLLSDLAPLALQVDCYCHIHVNLVIFFHRVLLLLNLLFISSE